MIKTTASKDKNSTNAHSSAPFFNKKGGGICFPQSQESERPFFSTSDIQTKLASGNPRDRDGQEANPAKGNMNPKQDNLNKPLLNHFKWGMTNSVAKDLSNVSSQLTQLMSFTQIIASGSEAHGPVQKGDPRGQEETIFIPEVKGTEGIISNFDGAYAKLNYLPSVSQGGIVTGSAFGTTNSALKFANIVVTHIQSPFIDFFHITGDLLFIITWEVRPSIGPFGEIDITDENDPDINANNYAAVASDLTPDSAGLTPKVHYWSRPITMRHEFFHAYKQLPSFGIQTATAIQNWLNIQTARTASDINKTMLRQAINEGVRILNALNSLPSTENDAYADCSPSYQALATAITTKGKAGKY